MAAEAVGFVLHGDACAECGEYGEGEGEVGVVVLRLDVDEQVVLGGGGLGCAFAVAGEVFQLGGFVVFQTAPVVRAEGEGHAELVAGEALLRGGEGIECGAAGGGDVFRLRDVGFDNDGVEWVFVEQGDWGVVMVVFLYSCGGWFCKWVVLCWNGFQAA